MYCEVCIKEDENSSAWYVKGSKEEMINAVKMQRTLNVKEVVDSTQFNKDQRERESRRKNVARQENAQSVEEE